MKHILEELVDLEYDVKDTLQRLTERIDYISVMVYNQQQKELKKKKLKQANHKA